MGVGILAKRVVLELGSSTNFVYSLKPAARKSRGWFVSCLLKNSGTAPIASLPVLRYFIT